MIRVIAIMWALILVGCSSNEVVNSKHTLALDKAKIIGSNPQVSNPPSGVAAGSGASAVGSDAKETTAVGVAGIAILGVAAPPTLLVSLPVGLMIWKNSQPDRSDKRNDVSVYYSYVLAGKTLEGSSARIKYDALIDEIRSRYPDLSSDSMYSVPETDSFNLYLIPETKSGETDYDLSKNLVNILADIKPEQFSKSGPYVVTTSEPLNRLTDHEQVDMYFFDLTDIELETIPEFVKDYREVDFVEVMGEFQEYKTLKLTIHSIIFKIDRFLQAGQREYSKFTEDLPSGTASAR